ncbi:hypothetical protein OH76DRAFT_1301494, partial [Lentinus brumalis]
PKEFSKETILKAVSEHVVCGQQALSVADNITFTNCLVAMRPATKKSELPSRSTVRSYINNSFIDYVGQLK